MRYLLSKNNIILTASILILLVISFLYINGQNSLAAGSDNVSGWAWSENVGWVSFNNTNQGSTTSYGVKVANNGNISGYAWSENVGWVSFNESSGCPSSPCAPRMNRGTGEISGWARACAGTVNGNCSGATRSDGWDGWIHLKGTNYGVIASGCNWDGYAWGSDVMGWVHFKGTNYGVVGTGDGCTAPPEPQPTGSSCTQNPDCQSNICQNNVCVSGSGGGCASNSQCQTGLLCLNGVCTVTPQCQDGIDNDNDGKTDYPADGGCVSSTDNDEKDLPQPVFKEVTP
ncbi:MAG: hypothetical protein HYW91_02050 [Candidatus Sungbacteria bacterium]|nr:hypothetical protein [Candidatus Sungbacteria bacterium]